MRGRPSKEVVGLALLLLAFVIGGVLVASPGQNGARTVGEELTADPSIYNTRASGSRALYEWTKQLGYDAQIDHVDWTHLPQESTLLISVAPESLQGFDIFGGATGEDSAGKLSQSDARGVLRWLRPGRTLLLLTSRLPVNTMYAGGPASGPPGSGDEGPSGKPTFGDIIGVTVDATQQGAQKNFVPMQTSALVAGVDSIQLSSGSSRVERRRRDAETLFGTVEPMPGNLAHGEPAVIVVPEQKGRIIVVADDYFASNRNLSQADNAAFLANIIDTSASRGSEILFDEFHHGDLPGAPTIWDAMGRALQAATWQVVLVCLLIVVMVAPRFGAIKPYRRGEERASGEYLTSLAGLYRRADATIPALEIIYRQFLRDLCERLALPPDVPLEKLAEVAARQSKIKPEAIKRLLAACETALDQKTVSSHDLLTLTKQMEQIKRQLS